MNSSFENDPRRKQEIRCRPYADGVYINTFGSNIQIERFDHTDNFILDKKFAMDVKITLPSGLVLFGQEKFLSSEQAKFKSVTVEFMQNSIEKGDWFKLGVQLYFTGYEQESLNKFMPWILLNWPAVVIATNNYKINWHDNRNKNGHAQASFRYAFMDEFPTECVIAKEL